MDDTRRLGMLPNLFVETDYTFGGMSGPNHSVAVHWAADPQYMTQVNYDQKTPCQLECRPPIGPDQIIAPARPFESFRVFELALDSTDRERQTLAVRRMYRAMAPWVTENPILMHCVSAKPDGLKLAIDQCAEVGFEMVIMTFGSGFKFENRDAEISAADTRNWPITRGPRASRSAAIRCWRSRGAATARPTTRKAPAPRYGVMPCLGAQWGVDYLAQIKSSSRTPAWGCSRTTAPIPATYVRPRTTRTTEASRIRSG